MLRRVGRVYWHHLQQSAVCYLHTAFIQPFHHSIRGKWSMAVALDPRRPWTKEIEGPVVGKTKPNARPREDVPKEAALERRQEDVARGRVDVKKPATVMSIHEKSAGRDTHPTQRLPLSHLPSELISMIDTLFGTTHGSVLFQLQKVKHSPVLSEYLLDRNKARELAEAMVQTPRPQRALRILLLASMLGCKLQQNAYECVAYQLAKTKHWWLIPSVVALGKRSTGRTTVRLLNWRARALVEDARYSHLAGILDGFDQAQLKPTRRTFHLLVSGYLRNRDLVMARQCFQQMEVAGFPVNASTHALVVSIYRSLGPDSQVQAHAFEALRDLGGATATTVVNSLMQLSIDADDVPGILGALSLLDQRTVSPHLLPNSGADFIRDDGGEVPFPCDPASPSIHVDVLSISPNAATFSLLLGYLVKRHDITRALCAAQQLPTAGIRPDAGIAASLVQIYLMAGDTATAVCIVADMCTKYEVSPGLWRFLGGDSIEHRPTSWLAGISPTVKVFNVLLKGTLVTRGLNGARVTLHIMRLCGIQPDTSTIEIIMRHLDRSEAARPREIIRFLRSLLSHKIRPTLGHVHIILRSILRREKRLLQGVGWNVTAAKFSPTRTDNFHYLENRTSGVTDSFDPTAGIHLPRELSYRGLMRPIVQSLTSRGVRSDRVTLALRIKRDAATKSDLQAAQEAFQLMLARGMHPNEYHFSALMEGQAKVGDLGAVRQTMASAVKAGLKLNVVMFTILIVGHARQGQPEPAMRAFRDMVAAGIKPDVPAVDAVASAYFAVGAYGMARRILLTMWPLVLPSETGPRGASLEGLVRHMRLRYKEKGSHASLPKMTKLTKEEERMLRSQLRQLVKEWRAKPRMMRGENGSHHEPQLSHSTARYKLP